MRWVKNGRRLIHPDHRQIASAVCCCKKCGLPICGVCPDGGRTQLKVRFEGIAMNPAYAGFATTSTYDLSAQELVDTGDVAGGAFYNSNTVFQRIAPPLSYTAGFGFYEFGGTPPATAPYMPFVVQIYANGCPCSSLSGDGFGNDGCGWAPSIGVWTPVWTGGAFVPNYYGINYFDGFNPCSLNCTGKNICTDEFIYDWSARLGPLDSFGQTMFLRGPKLTLTPQGASYGPGTICVDGCSNPIKQKTHATVQVNYQDNTVWPFLTTETETFPVYYHDTTIANPIGTGWVPFLAGYNGAIGPSAGAQHYCPRTNIGGVMVTPTQAWYSGFRVFGIPSYLQSLGSPTSKSCDPLDIVWEQTIPGGGSGELGNINYIKVRWTE